MRDYQCCVCPRIIRTKNARDEFSGLMGHLKKHFLQNEITEEEIVLTMLERVLEEISRRPGRRLT
jgi:hypothetical protein